MGVSGSGGDVVSAPAVQVRAHCVGSDMAPKTMIIEPNGTLIPDYVIVLCIGELSIHLTQDQAADVSLALTRAISDVDRMKAAPVLAEVER